MYIGILVRLDLGKFDLLIRVCQTRTIYAWDNQVNTIQISAFRSITPVEKREGVRPCNNKIIRY